MHMIRSTSISISRKVVKMIRMLLAIFCTLFIIRESVGDDEFAQKSQLPFWNQSLPWDQRLDDLLSRLKVDDMTYQLARGGADPNGPAPAIGRLQIGKYVWNTECLRGDAQAGNATAFPQALGLSAAFRFVNDLNKNKQQQQQNN